MKRIPVCLLAILLCAGLAAFSQVQRQRKVPPGPIVKSENKVDLFLKAVQDATTMNEVRAAFDRAGFTPGELEELKRKVEASPSAKQKTELLAKEEETSSAREIERAERAAKDRLAMISKGVIQKQEREIRNRSARMKQEASASLKARTDLASRLTADPNVVCAADSPSIDKIYGPITPGAEFGIMGKGLGPAPGSIDVIVDGRLFRADVNEWNACHVYAQLPNDVEGIKAGHATMVLKTNSGKEASKDTAFEPSLEFRYESSPWQVINSCFFGAHGDWTFFKYSLVNGWHVVDVRVTQYLNGTGGHAETTSEPEKNVNNVRATTQLHAGAVGVTTLHCNVTIYFAGPKGVPHKW